MVETTALVERVAQVMGVDKEKVVLKSVSELILSELRKHYAESVEIKQKYGVESAREIDESYQKGLLEEENSWRDFFRLSHLEERIMVLDELLSETSCLGIG